MNKVQIRIAGLLTAVFVLLTAEMSFAQTMEILRVLNREMLTPEAAIPGAGRKVTLPEHFSIKDSAGMQILILEVRQPNNDRTAFRVIRQEVALDKIKRIVKDINIIFETERNAVITTATDSDGVSDIRTGDLFFLQLSYQEHNEYLAGELIKAFKKAGFTIEKGYWYD